MNREFKFKISNPKIIEINPTTSLTLSELCKYNINQGSLYFDDKQENFVKKQVECSNKFDKDNNIINENSPKQNEIDDEYLEDNWIQKKFKDLEKEFSSGKKQVATVHPFM